MHGSACRPPCASPSACQEPVGRTRCPRSTRTACDRQAAMRAPVLMRQAALGGWGMALAAEGGPQRVPMAEDRPGQGPQQGPLRLSPHRWEGQARAARVAGALAVGALVCRPVPDLRADGPCSAPETCAHQCARPDLLWRLLHALCAAEHCQHAAARISRGCSV